MFYYKIICIYFVDKGYFWNDRYVLNCNEIYDSIFIKCNDKEYLLIFLSWIDYDNERLICIFG